MPNPNDKWYQFRKNKSDLVKIERMSDREVTEGKAKVHEDLKRNINTITVDGMPLKNKAQAYNNFEKKEDGRNFLEKELLGKIQPKNTKEKALKYLETVFHQGGLLCPTSSSLTAKPLAVSSDGNIYECRFLDAYYGDLNKRDSIISIKTTETGFEIQEITQFKQALVSMAIINADGNKIVQSSERYETEEGKNAMVKAEATISVDFSINPEKPRLTLKSNNLEMLDSRLGSFTPPDTRGFAEYIVDCLTDFLNKMFGTTQIEVLSEKDESESEGELPHP